MFGEGLASVSFTPGFSPVLGRRIDRKPFQRFSALPVETVETVSEESEARLHRAKAR
jgi:hypothetical protein